MSKVKNIKVESLVPDDRNFNKGTQFGQHLIDESLRRNGFGRSILIDKNNRIIAGNKTVENAVSIGLEDVIVVETTGDKIVAVKRTDVDLDTQQGREMALGDNATSKANIDWDIDELRKAEDEFAVVPADWGVEIPKVEEQWSEEDNDDFVDPLDQEDSFYDKMVKDVLFSTDNEYEIPTLQMDRMAGRVELPIVPWGANSRLNKNINTYHFYVDDYRFERIWKDPTPLINSGVRAIVEPNCSLHDQTPIAFGLHSIYKKRWLARYMQDLGVDVYADLNVAPKFTEYNKLGIPKGWNAFFTRGTTDWSHWLDIQYKVAQEISGLEHPNFIVYGGGKDVKEYCHKHDILYIEDYINVRKKEVYNK